MTVSRDLSSQERAPQLLRLAPGTNPIAASQGCVLTALMPRIAGGSRAAFEEAYPCLSRLAYGVARAVCVDPRQAEDATVHALVEVWTRAGSYDPSRGSAAEWVVGISHWQAVASMRAARLANPHAALPAGSRAPRPAGRPAPRDHALERRAWPGAREYLSGLSQLQQRVIGLAYFGGFTTAEVADILGVSATTVQINIRDGLRSAAGVG